MDNLPDVRDRIARARSDATVSSYLAQGLSGTFSMPRKEDAVFGLLAIMIAGVLEAVWTGGPEPWLPLRAALTALAFVFVLRFLFNTWIAPAVTERANTDWLSGAYERTVSERNDALSEVSALKGQVAKHEARKADQALADALQDEWDHGVHELLNAHPRTEDEHNAWRIEVVLWQERIEAIMNEHDCTRQEIAHVMTLREYTVNLALYEDRETNERFNMVNARCARLENMINDHTVKPITDG